MFNSDQYTLFIPIPMEDDLIHTDNHPLCDDPTCPCHLDVTNASLVEEADIHLVQIATVTDGLIR